jgi:hypothetical protein
MSAVATPNGNEPTIRAIVFKEGDFYVAQCLEYDIAAQGTDLEAAIDRLELTVEAEFETCALDGKAPKDCICPAPNYYHQLWDARSLELTRVAVESPHAATLSFALAKAA